MNQLKSTHSLTTQIAGVQHQIEACEAEYGRLVASRKMRKSEAEYRISVLRNVQRTLIFLVENETVIRAAIAATKDESKDGNRQAGENACD